MDDDIKQNSYDHGTINSLLYGVKYIFFRRHHVKCYLDPMTILSIRLTQTNPGTGYKMPRLFRVKTWNCKTKCQQMTSKRTELACRFVGFLAVFLTTYFRMYNIYGKIMTNKIYMRQ
jgi:hypothetical protein